MTGIEVDFVKAYPSVLSSTANADDEEREVFRLHYPTTREGKSRLYSMLDSRHPCAGDDPYETMCRQMRTWCARTDDCAKKAGSFAAAALNEITYDASRQLCKQGLRPRTDFVAFADQIAIRDPQHVGMVEEAMLTASVEVVGVPMDVRVKATDYSFDERQRLLRKVPSECTVPALSTT